MPEKILYVDTELFWRGGQDQLLSLILGMKERGHDVWLAAPGDAPLAQKVRASSVPVLPFRQRGELSLLSFIKLFRILRNSGFQVVHFNTPRALVVGGLAAKLAGVPVTVASRRVNFPLKRRLSALKYNWVVDRVLTVSSSIRETLIDDGVKPELVEVVYEGVDLSSMSRETNSLRGIQKSGPIVGTMAYMSQEKGYDVLLEAIRLLRRQFPNVNYWFAGDGELRSELEELAEKLGVTAQVTFLGFRSDIEALLPVFDIFCLPSLSEGLSSAILAAMAAELPVVSTTVGGIPELVDCGKSGILVPPKDPTKLAQALEKLLSSPSLRKQMGTVGRKRIEEFFTVEMKVARTEAIYTSLLQSRGVR